jgi:hypothetical protein
MKVNVKEVGWGVDRGRVAQDRVQWRTLVKTNAIHNGQASPE